MSSPGLALRHAIRRVYLGDQIDRIMQVEAVACVRITLESDYTSVLLSCTYRGKEESLYQTLNQGTSI